MHREIENILRKLYETIERFYPDDVKIDDKKYLEKSGLINLLNNQQGNLSFLIDVRHLRVVQASGNILKYTGYSEEEFSEGILMKFLTMFEKEHHLFMSTIINWVLNIEKNLDFVYKTRQFISAWGMKLRDKENRLMRWYINIIPVEFNVEKYPTVVILSIQDVTHLVKGDEYCIRGSFGMQEKKVFVYYSGEKRTLEHDIVSEREREVLQYIAQGLDTKHIATEMKISPNTVDNHRRNMLARTGTRDTTALIQICRMVGVL
ncbi:transcriptional regulator, LuxR family [Emticicia oligotrophica DSM 17448]|uniref:Transcriptional regulator, LuxR family n=1 Tax=Emticicia oligotrophica (strain DSM 17448 / CIP 109782 / MTCC 6937 / GPTSA100-15) TaxID=929562 RepID=A0ABM5MZJ2_EMTOG|nr:LuxR C-terminal-related transcriptional regulator [Emticicia oligotrophica]AFK02560.1 transcriptional regulator, LuxR family [Emticicia oligotrophica DSM 17448]